MNIRQLILYFLGALQIPSHFQGFRRNNHRNQVKQPGKLQDRSLIAWPKLQIQHDTNQNFSCLLKWQVVLSLWKYKIHGQNNLEKEWGFGELTLPWFQNILSTTTVIRSVCCLHKNRNNIEQWDRTEVKQLTLMLNQQGVQPFPGTKWLQQIVLGQVDTQARMTELST